MAWTNRTGAIIMPPKPAGFCFNWPEGMNYVIITCDPANTASSRTCQIAGGKYMETADIPEDNEMYAEGKRQVMIYRFDL